MKICFTKHVQEKLKEYEGGKIIIIGTDIIETLIAPDYVDVKSRVPQFIAQKSLGAKHVLRVVYLVETARDKIKVITFYPGRKSKYEKHS